MPTAGTFRSRLDRRAFHAPRMVDRANRDLDRLVAVKSRDVRVHLARINALIDARATSDALYGALVDLFITTSASASEVRTRALFWARDLLRADHRAALEEHVQHGLTSTSPMPPSLWSVLSLGVTGSTTLVGPAGRHREVVA